MTKHHHPYLYPLISSLTNNSFATTLDPTLGPISLGLLYLFWIISLLTISTSAVNYLTPKYAMFFGSLTYPLYVASGIELGHPIFVTLYLVAAILIGIGAGLVWVGESVFIVQCCNYHEKINNLSINSKLGTFNGVFNFYLQFSRFAGSLIAALIFQFNGSLLAMFIVMIVIGIAGSFTFIAIKKMDTNKNESDSASEPTKYSRVNSGSIQVSPSAISSPSFETEDITHEAGAEIELEPVVSNTPTSTPKEVTDIEQKSDFEKFKQEMKDIILFYKNKTFLWLIPITIVFGLFTTFISGDVATLIEDHAFKFYVLTVEGFIAGVSSFVMGKCADKWGSLYFILLSCICFNCVYIFFYFWRIDQNAIWIWMIIAILLGIGDGGILTLIPQIYPILLGDANAVFANMRIWQSLALGVGFAYYPITSFEFRITTNVIMVTVGCICILIPKHIRNALIVSQS